MKCCSRDYSVHYRYSLSFINMSVGNNGGGVLKEREGGFKITLFLGNKGGLI